MAKAEKKNVENYDMVLTLNKDEAETLLIVTGKIGGVPERTRRRFMNNIRKALQTAGVNEVQTTTTKNSPYQGIWFEDETL